MQDLQESRRTLVIIRLTTPLSLTSNEPARENRPWNHARKRHVSGNPTPLVALTVCTLHRGRWFVASICATFNCTPCGIRFLIEQELLV